MTGDRQSDDMGERIRKFQEFQKLQERTAYTRGQWRILLVGLGAAFFVIMVQGKGFGDPERHFLAFKRTYDLVVKGAFGDVMLLDVGIIVGLSLGTFFLGVVVLAVLGDIVDAVKDWWRSSTGDR